MTRSQWLIKGIDENGKPTEVHHHGMEGHRRMPDGTWVFMDHPFGADPDWAVEARRTPNSKSDTSSRASPSQDHPMQELATLASIVAALSVGVTAAPGPAS